MTGWVSVEGMLPRWLLFDVVTRVTCLNQRVLAKENRTIEVLMAVATSWSMMKMILHAIIDGPIIRSARKARRVDRLAYMTPPSAGASGIVMMAARMLGTANTMSPDESDSRVRPSRMNPSTKDVATIAKIDLTGEGALKTRRITLAVSS
jgi:hypothetical protein